MTGGSGGDGGCFVHRDTTIVCPNARSAASQNVRHAGYSAGVMRAFLKVSVERTVTLPALSTAETEKVPKGVSSCAGAIGARQPHAGGQADGPLVLAPRERVEIHVQRALREGGVVVDEVVRRARGHHRGCRRRASRSRAPCPSSRIRTGWSSSSRSFTSTPALPFASSSVPSSMGEIALRPVAPLALRHVALAPVGGVGARDGELEGERPGAVGSERDVELPPRGRGLGRRLGEVDQLGLALVDLEREGAAVHDGELVDAGVLGGAVEVEVERGDVGDGVIEGREARRRGLDAAAHARADEDDGGGDARLAEHGDDDRRLVLAVAPAARDRLRAAAGLDALEAQLERDVAEARGVLVDGPHLGGVVLEALRDLLDLAPDLVVHVELIAREAPVERAHVVPALEGGDVDVRHDLRVGGHHRLRREGGDVVRR